MKQLMHIFVFSISVTVFSTEQKTNVLEVMNGIESFDVEYIHDGITSRLPYNAQRFNNASRIKLQILDPRTNVLSEALVYYSQNIKIKPVDEIDSEKLDWRIKIVIRMISENEDLVIYIDYNKNLVSINGKLHYVNEAPPELRAIIHNFVTAPYISVESQSGQPKNVNP